MARSLKIRPQVAACGLMELPSSNLWSGLFAKLLFLQQEQAHREPGFLPCNIWRDVLDKMRQDVRLAKIFGKRDYREYPSSGFAPHHYSCKGPNFSGGTMIISEHTAQHRLREIEKEHGPAALTTLDLLARQFMTTWRQLVREERRKQQQEWKDEQSKWAAVKATTPQPTSQL